MKKIYLLLVLAISSQIVIKAQSWNTIAPMDSMRAGLSLVTLADGSVLSAGGRDTINHRDHASARVYNPGTNTWSAAGNMSGTRYRAKAVLLNTGKVLIVGGYNADCSCVLKTCELYDPTTKTFSLTGSMSVQRYAHTLTLLNNGKVLVVGGSDGVTAGFLASAEIYDPSTGVWSPAASMSIDRELHTATLLNSGKVLVTGGNNWNLFQVTSAEIYDPVNNTWSAATDMTTIRDTHAAVKLATGEVLVSGGRYFVYATSGPYVGHYMGIVDAEIYNETGNSWNYISNAMTPGMSNHRLILLNDGNVLSVAGVDSCTSRAPWGNSPSVTQIYNVASQSWSPIPMNIDSRYDVEAVKLNNTNGDVLVCGGYTTSCEIFSSRVGISTYNLEDKRYTVYCSPNEKTVIIHSSARDKENSTVSIYDVTGRIVKETILPAFNENLLIPVEELTNGIYIVKISNSNSTSSKKIVLQ